MQSHLSQTLVAYLLGCISVVHAVDNDAAPLIIWWYKSIFPHAEEDGKGLYDVNCGNGKFCLATTNRDSVKDSDKLKVIVFYGSDFTPDDVPLPRLSNEMWALLHEESPQNNFILCQEELLELFNFSSTFKQNSDFPLTTQHIPSVQYLYKKSSISIEDKNKFRRAGYATTIYVQSNCDVPSDRDRYVSELMKHMQIDSYGKCLHNANFTHSAMEGMESMQDEEFLALLSKYKFHLSFENAICDDYITEKIYRALHVGSVPIYMGAGNIDHWVPSGSILKVTDFPSPKELAQYLALLDKDDDLYLHYLRYKIHITTLPSQVQKLLENRAWSATNLLLPHFVEAYECFICREIHMIKEKMAQGRWMNSKVVNKSHFDCPFPHPSLKSVALDNSDRFHAWMNEYKQSSYQAKALRGIVAEAESDPAMVWDRVGDMMIAELHHDEF